MKKWITYIMKTGKEMLMIVSTKFFGYFDEAYSEHTPDHELLSITTCGQRLIPSIYLMTSCLNCVGGTVIVNNSPSVQVSTNSVP